MNTRIAIRNETDADVSAITEVTVAAFETLEISNHGDLVQTISRASYLWTFRQTYSAQSSLDGTLGEGLSGSMCPAGDAESRDGPCSNYMDRIGRCSGWVGQAVVCPPCHQSRCSSLTPGRGILIDSLQSTHVEVIEL